MKKLKSKLLIVVTLFSFLLGMYNVDAASLTTTISSSTSSTVVGNTITITVRLSSSAHLGVIHYSMSYDTNKLTLTSGTQSNALVFKGTEKNTTITFKFKAKASGTGTVTFKINEAIDFDGNNLSGSKQVSKSINIRTQAEIEASYSKNNNLSSLKVSSGTLSPSFNKNTTSYNVTVDNNVSKITVSGSREDSKSSVSGLTTYNLDEGANKIRVKVTAQNGSTKTYTITVTRKELDPINVRSIDNEELTVVRKKEQLTKPNDYFEESTVNIDEKNNVPSLLYKMNDNEITLVGLKDKEGNIGLYQFINNEYVPYNEIKSSTVVLINKEYKDSIPEGFKEKIITIDGKEYNAYQKDNTDYYLLYGTSLETGETNLYLYEAKEKTLQLYKLEKAATDSSEITNKRIEKRNYLIIALAILLALTYLVILISLVRGYSKKKKRKEERQEEKRKQEELLNKQKELEAMLEEERKKNKIVKEENKKEENKKRSKKKESI